MQKPPKSQVFETCLVISTGLLLFYIYWAKLREEPVDLPVLVYIAAGVGFLGALVYPLSRWIHWLWFRLADVLGFVMPKVILSTIFFVFLTPIAFLNRLFTKDKLGLKKKDDTYWKTREHTFSPSDLENPW